MRETALSDEIKKLKAAAQISKPTTPTAAAAAAAVAGGGDKKAADELAEVQQKLRAVSAELATAKESAATHSG